MNGFSPLGVVIDTLSRAAVVAEFAVHAALIKEIGNAELGATGSLLWST